MAWQLAFNLLTQEQQDNINDITAGCQQDENELHFTLHFPENLAHVIDDLIGHDFALGPNDRFNGHWNQQNGVFNLDDAFPALAEAQRVANARFHIASANNQPQQVLDQTYDIVRYIFQAHQAASLSCNEAMHDTLYPTI